MAVATGRPFLEILSQPADRTVYEFYRWWDDDRRQRLLARLDRVDQSEWNAAASWDGKEHSRAKEALMHDLRRHPDPDVEQKLIAERLAKGMGLIERASVIGGRKE